MAGHSFIDIAVLDPVRARFAAGDALILVDQGLDTIIWANGAGAALLGQTQVAAAIGAETGFSPAARRQIMATPGFPEIGENRTVIVRIGQGASRAVLFRASAVVLPGRDAAILLASPIADPARASEQIVAGLSGPGEEAALVDDSGNVLAATPGFASAAPDSGALKRLVEEAAREPDRLVKRIVGHGARRTGIGLARLEDAPARYLAVIVADVPVAEATPASGAEPPAKSDAAPLDGWYFSGDDEGRISRSGPAGNSPAEPAATPVRFAWRTDADGRFSAVSPEFASAVGASAADIVGRTFADVARVFGIDPDGVVAGLLNRRDTWSGRTVFWPVAGSAQKAPVDLAALPAYTRDRSFDGFRGFGVVRRSDAIADPEGIGLTLVERAPPRQHGASRDPFRGEAPALTTADPAEPPSTGKIVRLPARRDTTPGRELSQNEHLAFREIGDRLKHDEPRPSGANDDHAPGTPPHFPEFDATPGSADGLVEDDGAAGVEPTLPEPEPFWPEDRAIADFAEDVVDDPRLDAAFVEKEVPRAAELEADIPLARIEEQGIAAANPALLARLPLPMLVHSGDRLHFANDEFLERTGYASLDELNAAGGLGALIAGPYPENDETPARRRAVRLVTKNGVEFPVDAHLQTIPWSDGRALLLSLRPAAAPAIAPAPLVAETQAGAGPSPAPADAPPASDEALQRRIAELETILDTATDGIVTVDRDGAIRTVSRAAEALFGFDAADLAGKAFVSLFATESQRSARDYLASLDGSGVASVLNDGREAIGREAKGGFIPLFMTIGRLPGGGYCVVLRDITQFKRAEEELTQARRKAETASSQKSDFLARVSHEIRTPLNAIIGFSELMMDEKFGPVGNERYRDYLRDINKSGNHVLDLVNDLLDISKIEAGQQDLSYEAVRLNETLGEAVSLMQPQANRERVIIRSSLASNLPEVVADLRSVKQIALNLLSNAVRFTNPGGQVIVSTAYEPNGDVALRVRDTGIGMSRPEIEQALKPFKQVSTLKRPRGDGTGLGLPLTKALVEANRARFAISSTPGEGTMVEVIFPSTRVLAG